MAFKGLWKNSYKFLEKRGLSGSFLDFSAHWPKVPGLLFSPLPKWKNSTAVPLWDQTPECNYYSPNLAANSFFFMQSGSPTGNQNWGLHTPVAQLLLLVQHPLHQALSSAHILCHREVAYSTSLTAGMFQEQKSLLCQQLVYSMVLLDHHFQF